MNTPSDEVVLNLINSLYETAGNQSPETWTEVFNRVLSVLSSGPGSLSLYSPNNKRFDLFVSTLNKELVEEYNEYYQYISPFRDRILQMETGDRFIRAAHCSDKKFIKTEIYQEYFKKQDVFNYEYEVLFKEGEAVAGVSFSRPKRMKNFSIQELKLMRLIIPHLRRALQIHIKFAEVQREKQILSESFERISQGIIVVNKFGKIVFLNDIANKLINKKDGLQTDCKGTLSASFANDSKKLRTFLQGVFEPNLGRNVNRGNVLQIPRTSGLRPLLVFISPFSENNQSIFNSEKLALLFINDPEQRMADFAPILCQIYGLTPSESKIAAILADGVSSNDACEILGIKQNTIRTHLKRVFSKTETNRQSELVKLIVGNLQNVKNFT